MVSTKWPVSLGEAGQRGAIEPVVYDIISKKYLENIRHAGKQADKLAGGMEGTVASQSAFIVILLPSALCMPPPHTHAQNQESFSYIYIVTLAF